MANPEWWPFYYRKFWSSPQVAMLQHPEHVIWYIKLLSDQADMAFQGAGLPVEEEYLRGLCSRAWPVDPSSQAWESFCGKLDQLFPVDKRSNTRANRKQADIMGRSVANYKAKVGGAKKARAKKLDRHQDMTPDDDVSVDTTDRSRSRSRSTTTGDTNVSPAARPNVYEGWNKDFAPFVRTLHLTVQPNEVRSNADTQTLRWVKGCLAAGINPDDLRSVVAEQDKFFASQGKTWSPYKLWHTSNPDGWNSFQRRLGAMHKKAPPSDLVREMIAQTKLGGGQ